MAAAACADYTEGKDESQEVPTHEVHKDRNDVSRTNEGSTETGDGVSEVHERETTEAKNSGDRGADSETGVQSSGDREQQAEMGEAHSTDTLEALVVAEYLSRFAPPEGLSTNAYDQLQLYSRNAARLMEKKVSIRDAARKVLRASRKEGVPDTLIVKIFQCLKTVDESGRAAKDNASSGGEKASVPGSSGRPSELDNVSIKEIAPPVSTGSNERARPDAAETIAVDNGAQVEKVEADESQPAKLTRSAGAIGEEDSGKGEVKGEKEGKGDSSDDNEDNDNTSEYSEYTEETVSEYEELSYCSTDTGITHTNDVQKYTKEGSSSQALVVEASANEVQKRRDRGTQSKDGDVSNTEEGSRSVAPVVEANAHQVNDDVHKDDSNKAECTGRRETLEQSQPAPPRLSRSLSEDSSSASAAQIDYETKFGEMEEVDENENIQAFLNRFKTLQEGGHFPDANVEALEDLGEEEEKDDTDNVEVDLVHGFVKKDLLIVEQELTEEERLWSEDTETDLFRKYSDFLKKMPVEVKKPAEIDDGIESGTQDCLQKQQVAEMRDVNFGDAEVFLMEESTVEVAYVDEEEYMRATEKTRNKEKWEFAKAFKKSMNRRDDVVRGRKVNQGDKSRVKRSAVIPMRNQKLAALEKMFEDRDKKIIRRYQSRNNPQVAHWVSPWEKQHEYDATNVSVNTMPGQSVAPAIDGVAAAAAMASNRSRRSRLSAKRHWRRPYEERIKAHAGYFDVDFYSLYDSSAVMDEPHHLDSVSWEDRDVKQYFLRKDIAFSRNWFGTFIKERGNDRNFEPVCHPRSTKMTNNNLPDPGEWEEDWYTTWKSRKENPNNLKLFEREENMEESDSGYDDQSYGSKSEDTNRSGERAGAVKTDENFHYDDDSFWEKAPEVGELCTVRLKIGERVSRVTWEHTSSLRRSRWRRKYLPKSKFSQS